MRVQPGKPYGDNLFSRAGDAKPRGHETQKNSRGKGKCRHARRYARVCVTPLSFGASHRRFTRGLTVDGYKSRVNIVPVNSAGSERALGFDSESEGVVVPVVCTCRYLRRDTKRERGRKMDRTSVHVCACVFPKGLWMLSGISYFPAPRSSVCPRFYFDLPTSFSRYSNRGLFYSLRSFLHYCES